jgi:hypothetical protein
MPLTRHFVVCALAVLVGLTSLAPARVPARELTSAQRKHHIALLQAIVAGDADATRRAIDAGADPNLNVDGKLPLEAAIVTGEIEVVRALLNGGADPKARTDDGKTLYGKAYELAGGVDDSVLKPIGDLLKARAEGKVDPNAGDEKPDAEAGPQVILMPEAVVRSKPEAQPEFAAYPGAQVPDGWNAFTTNEKKIVILSNGKTGADAGRVVFLEPEMRSSDDLDELFDWTDHNLRSYAKMIGVKGIDKLTVEITLKRVSPVPAGEKKPVRIEAAFTIWDYPLIAGSVEMTGVLDEKGEFRAILNHRGRSDEAQKSYAAYLQAVSKCLPETD